MKYVVTTFRDAGLEAKWTKTRAGAPVIAVRNPQASIPHQRDRWHNVDGHMWARMQSAGIVEGFNQVTMIADIFSV